MYVKLKTLFSVDKSKVKKILLEELDFGVEGGLVHCAAEVEQVSLSKRSSQAGNTFLEIKNFQTDDIR